MPGIPDPSKAVPSKSAQASITETLKNHASYWKFAAAAVGPLTSNEDQDNTIDDGAKNASELPTATDEPTPRQQDVTAQPSLPQPTQ